MRRYLLALITLAFAACDVHVGDDFDANFPDSGDWFADSGRRKVDAGKQTTTPKKDAGRSDGGRTEEDAGGLVDAGELIDSGLVDPGRPVVLKPSDVPGVLAAGFCGALEACVGKTLAAATLKGTDCIEFRTRQLADRHWHWLTKSVTSDSIRFRPELLEACKKDLIALGCTASTRRLPESCEQAVEGKADFDQVCAIDQDCGGIAYCDKGMMETCPGVCAPLQATGLPCATSDQCGDGLICRAKACVLPPVEGDTCTVRFGAECGTGLVCQGKAGMLTCQKVSAVYVGALDGVCDRNAQLCADGLVCQSQNAMNTVGKCVKPAAAGGTCKQSEPSQCPSSQYCKALDSTKPPAGGADGVCSVRPIEGQTCSLDSSTMIPDCAPGHWCVGDPGKCRAYKQAGGECLSNQECYGGSCVDGKCAVTTMDCR